jgi:hypothetical protein
MPFARRETARRTKASARSTRTPTTMSAAASCARSRGTSAGTFLTVAVHRDEHPAGRDAHAEPERGRLSRVPREAEDATLRPARSGRGKHGVRAVGAAVVDQHDLVRPLEAAQHLLQLGQKRTGVLGLVAEGDDDRPLRRLGGRAIVGIMRAYLGDRARAKAAREHTLASAARGRHNS